MKWVREKEGERVKNKGKRDLLIRSHSNVVETLNRNRIHKILEKKTVFKKIII